MNLLPGDLGRRHASASPAMRCRSRRPTPAARDVIARRPARATCASAPSGLPAQVERVEDLGDSAIVSLTAGDRRSS